MRGQRAQRNYFLVFSYELDEGGFSLAGGSLLPLSPLFPLLFLLLGAGYEF